MNATQLCNLNLSYSVIRALGTLDLICPSVMPASALHMNAGNWSQDRQCNSPPVRDSNNPRLLEVIFGGGLGWDGVRTVTRGSRRSRWQFLSGCRATCTQLNPAGPPADNLPAGFAVPGGREPTSRLTTRFNPGPLSHIHSASRADPISRAIGQLLAADGPTSAAAGVYRVTHPVEGRDHTRAGWINQESAAWLATRNWKTIKRA